MNAPMDMSRPLKMWRTAELLDFNLDIHYIREKHST